MNSSIYLSKKDIYLINSLFADDEAVPAVDRERRKKLEALVASAKDPNQPKKQILAAGLNDFVTINEPGAPASDEFEFKLVMPHEANLAKDKISILSPLGMAVLGRQAEEVVNMDTPEGDHKLIVLKVETIKTEALATSSVA